MMYIFYLLLLMSFTVYSGAAGMELSQTKKKSEPFARTTSTVIDEDIYIQNGYLVIELAVPNAVRVIGKYITDNILQVKVERKQRDEKNKRYLIKGISRDTLTKEISIPRPVTNDKPVIKIKDCVVVIKMKLLEPEPEEHEEEEYEEEEGKIIISD